MTIRVVVGAGTYHSIIAVDPVRCKIILLVPPSNYQILQRRSSNFVKNKRKPSRNIARVIKG